MLLSQPAQAGSQGWNHAETALKRHVPAARGQRARRASNWRLTGGSRAGTSLWSRTVKSGGRSKAGSPGARHHCAGRPGRDSRASAVKASQASRPPGATAPAAAANTAGSQKPVHRTSAYDRGDGDQADRSACTSVIRWPSPRRPSLVAEQPERHLRDVHGGDPAPMRRGQQRRARGPAGQVGHRPIGQVRGQRPEDPHRQRMRGERRREADRIRGVPPDLVGMVARHWPGGCVVRGHERGSYGRGRAWREKRRGMLASQLRHGVSK